MKLKFYHFVILGLIIFIFDILKPLEYNDWVFYCFILGFSSKFCLRKNIFKLALIFSVFIITAFFLAQNYETQAIQTHIRGSIMLWFLAYLLAKLKEEQNREQKIRKEQEVIYNRIEEIVFGLDKNWKVTYKNAASDKMGYSFVNVGDNFFEKLPNVVGTNLDLNLKKAMATQKPITFNYQTLYTPTPHIITFTIYPSEEGVSVFSKDITELEQTREKLSAATQRIYEMFNRLDDLCWAIDNNFNLTYVNDKVLDWTGKTRSELVGQNLWEVYPLLKDTIAEKKLVEALKTQRHIQFEMKSIYAEGKYLSFSLSPDEEGVTVIVQDITDNKEAKIQLQQALQERDFLHKELFHRVKNNLQIISSIISLEMNSIGDNRFEEIMSDIIKRIKSISIMHSRLHEKETISKINVAAYIREIVDYLSSSYSRPDIKVITALEEIELDSKLATPMGMLLNELVSNSFKYAYRQGSVCEININLFRTNGCVHLVVKDNGRGYPESLLSDETLGMRLVKFFAEQLEGDIRIENRDGAYSELEFCI